MTIHNHQKRSNSWSNVIANAIGRLWIIIGNILMFPVYLNILGQEKFGIIALLTSVTAIFTLFDFGISPVLARELNNQTRTPENRLDLLKTIELPYLSILLIIVCASAIAPSVWLEALIKDPLEPDGGETSLRLVLFVAVAQLVFTFYIAAISGTEHQIRSNILSLSTGLLRNVGVAVPLLIYPKINIFLWWQLSVTIFATLVARRWLIAILRPDTCSGKGKFSIANLCEILPAAEGSFLLATAATINLNFDRLFVSRLEGLASVGEYTVVATFAQLIFVSQLPITMAATPRMVRAITIKDLHSYEYIMTCTRTAVGIVATIMMVIFVWHGPQLIGLWSGGAITPSNISGYSGWLFMGAAASAFSAIWHSVAVAHQDYSFGRLYIYSMLFVIPFYYCSTAFHGVAGAAAAWGSTQLVVMLAYRYWVGRRLLKDRPSLATPWAGIACGALSALFACLLFGDIEAAKNSLIWTLATIAIEITISGILTILTIGLIVRRIDNTDGLGHFFHALIVKLYRMPSRS